MQNKSQLIVASEAAPPFFVGLDLGGTNIKVGVVDDLGRTLSYLSVPTEVAKGAEDAASRMGKAVLRAIEEAKLKPSDIARVGLGSPGSMDIPAGKLLAPVNLKGWNDFPLRDRVAHYCGLPVSFENDANAAAYGEYWVGAGKAHHSLVLLTLGTGIGSGIIIGDTIVRGEHSHGGECGHMTINCGDDAMLCNCGQRGHLEAYASANGVIRRARRGLSNGTKTTLADRLASGAELTPLLLSKEAENGDAFAMNLILETARYLGIGIVNILHTIDPNIVLLGGAMTFGGDNSAIGRRFLEAVRSEVRSRAFSVLAERTVIDFATLGGDAGYIGAAGIARLERASSR
jgi:glucokinase